MALRTPPSWLQNGSHPAENDRLTNQAISSSTGVIGANSLFVSAAGGSLSISVGTGWATIVSSTASAGVYSIYNDAATSLSVTAGDATNPRIDRIVATINDSFYSGAINNVVFSVITGTPAGSPVAPAIPSNSISLATVAVAALATVVVQANLTDTRIAMASNVLHTNNYYSLSASRSLTAASTLAQDVFGVAITLQPNTTYEIEWTYALNFTLTTAVANTISSNGATTGVGSIDGQAFSGVGTGTVTPFLNKFAGGPTTTANVATTAATATAYSIGIQNKVIFRTGNATGTFRPQVTFSGNNTSGISIDRNAYIKANVLGPAAALSVGAWA